MQTLNKHIHQWQGYKLIDVYDHYFEAFRQGNES